VCVGEEWGVGGVGVGLGSFCLESLKQHKKTRILSRSPTSQDCR
jgi:hypothetical protein